MKTLKYIAVFISAIIGLDISFSTGPLSVLGSIFAIDERYFQTLQYQYYYSGLVTAVLACLVGYIVKANLNFVFAALLLAGVLWVVYTQSGDPGFQQYLASAVFEFMVPYGFVCLVIIFATFGINKKWPRLT